MEDTEFGGKLSVRKPENSKILIAFGHDEAIYNKNSFTKKSWSGTNGEIAIVPKEDVTCLMVSAVQSREFGFGFRTLTKMSLIKSILHE